MTSLFSHLPDVIPADGFCNLEEQAVHAEAWETPVWAVEAILKKELLTHRVLDPCCGTGVLSIAAQQAGYSVYALDRYSWGFGDKRDVDWLFFGRDDLPAGFCEKGFTVLMNPPFSRATAFVDHAWNLGARKIVCFQRQAWRESRDRRKWWERRPPARVWLCGDRAHSWLFTVPPENRKGGRFMPCAWFVWERGHRGAEISDAIWRDNA